MLFLERASIEKEGILSGPTEISTDGSVTTKGEPEVVPTVDFPVLPMVSPGMKSNSTQKSTLALDQAPLKVNIMPAHGFP